MSTTASTTEQTTPLHHRLREEAAALSMTVWATLHRRFPALAELPPAVEPSAGTLVLPLVEALLDGSTRALENRCRRQARLLVRDGHPQQLLVDVHDFAMSLVIAQLWSHGRPGDYAELTEITRRAAAVLETAHKTVVDTFWAQAHADRFGRHGRRTLAHGLLTGSATPELVAAAGVSLDHRYRAVVLRGPGTATTWRAAVSERLHERGVLHCVLGEEVVAFESESCETPLFVVGARTGLGRVSVGAAEPVRVVDLPLAVAEARRLAALACTVPLLDIVVSASQLPLELTLLQDEALAASMCAIAAPIATRPDLLDTIQVLYQLDLNRTSTARRLGIARRTLSGRLTRIHELTGLDPTSTRGIQILYTALTALSMRRVAGAAEGA